MSVWSAHRLAGLQAAKLRLLGQGAVQTTEAEAKAEKRIVVILIKVEGATAETQTMKAMIETKPNELGGVIPKQTDVESRQRPAYVDQMLTERA